MTKEDIQKMQGLIGDTQRSPRERELMSLILGFMITTNARLDQLSKSATKSSGSGSTTKKTAPKKKEGEDDAGSTEV